METKDISFWLGVDCDTALSSDSITPETIGGMAEIDDLVLQLRDSN